MSAFPSPPLPTSFPSPLPAGRDVSGAGGRSTASVRLRYRRQTAALMLGTMFAGLWLALAAPSVSPVTPVNPPVVLGAANPLDGSATDLPDGTRRGDQRAGAGVEGRHGARSHRR